MANRTTPRQLEHDTAVRLLAAHWNSPTKYNIATNPNGQKNRWAGKAGCFPDVIGWTHQNGRETAMWIVEVETADSVSADEAMNQWKEYASTGIPLSLAVPSGCGATAWKLAVRFGVSLKTVYEFSLVNGQLRVVEVSPSYAGV